MRETLFDFASNELYKHVSKLGDRLNKNAIHNRLEKIQTDPIQSIQKQH